MEKYIYFFDEGNKSMKETLGGKGANLAEMTGLRLPVPPGFTITTDICKFYYDNGKKYPQGFNTEVKNAVEKLEKRISKSFGDESNPLLVSVRSGAAASMPGMMDTILNLGLNDKVVQGFAKKTKNERFVMDSYRRLIQMFGDVVMGVEHADFEKILEKAKEKRGTKFDTNLTAADLKWVIGEYKKLIKKVKKEEFPQNPMKQLQMAIDAVFGSWNNPRAIKYRELNDIRGLKGTAINVQAMVFGNMGEKSATGVCFTRNPSTGEKQFYGEYLVNAQGEDVVAGIRTPKHMDDLAKEMPHLYKELTTIMSNVEKHYKDMQDMEFTIEEGKLYILQTRNGKRTAMAAVRIAVELVSEGMIDRNTALLRVDPTSLNQLLHKQINTKAKLNVIGKGLPASPGAAVGKVVFNAEDAEEWSHEKGEKVVLVRNETSPEDIHGMAVAEGILTSKGGMTCVSGDALVLTNRGFLTAESAFQHLEGGEQLDILSYDTKLQRAKWRGITAAGRRLSEVIEVSTSQTGRSEGNSVRMTPDHKMMVIQDRRMTKKPLHSILHDGDFVSIVDRVPNPNKLRLSSEKLAYLAGAIFTDGYINLRRTKGSVTFTQKPTPEKTQFIETVGSYFEEVFGKRFNITRERTTSGYIQGRHIQGSCADLICTSMGPAVVLTKLNQNMGQWVMNLDEASTFSFLAGVIDGDGSFHNNRIQIYASKENLLQGVVLACLKLGILPQVTVNRGIYNVQIIERVNDILTRTKRVKGVVRRRLYESKLFSIKQLFSDLQQDVNYMGRVKGAIKRNLLFGAEKIERDILPLCGASTRKHVMQLLESDLRMYRVKKFAELGKTYVYNFEVDADSELNKNFVVFTTRYTPLLVSNSHAAVVARGMGKCCVAGAEEIRINYEDKELKAGGHVIKEGDWISLNGNTGEIILGQAPVVDPVMKSEFGTLMKWADETRKLGVRANAETPKDAKTAREFGAEGIGLARTEHMFFEGDRIIPMREMILSETVEGRKKALAKLLPLQRGDFEELFSIMDGLDVTIRLLDPPLHEFMPVTEEGEKEVAKQMGISVETVREKVKSLHEINPMLGFRGCRLLIVYPEITEMQTRAIYEAAVNVLKKGIKVKPEVMIPVVASWKEMKIMREIVDRTARGVLKEKKVSMPIKIGTMIELPRAALTADKIAEYAEFFSFGTNDLTQTTFGFSRDDSGKFIQSYKDQGILDVDPFAAIDQEGVGQLIEMSVERGRKTRPELKVGICGEQGGEPSSVEFCHKAGLTYVSCSPYRVPIARLAAAHAAIKYKK